MSKKCKHHEENVIEIIPGLWLGNIESSHDPNFIKQKEIRHIIRVMPEFDETKVHKNVQYLHIPISDNKLCSINLNGLFDYTNKYIKEKLLNKENVLVHCKRGHHRSAAIIVAFLIKCLNVDYFDAVLYVGYLRPCALRRNTCIGQYLFKYYLDN